MTAMVTLLLLIGGTSGYWLLWSLNSSYQALENDAIADDLHRAIDGLKQQLTTLDEVTREWAHWTEMAEFIESGDPAFRDENLNPEGLRSSRIDGIAVLSPSGHIKALASATPPDEATKNDALVPDAELLSRLDAIPALADGGKCGLIENSPRLLLICKRNVLDTKGQGPARGTILVSREFNEESVARLAMTTRLKLSLYPAATTLKGAQELPWVTAEPSALTNPPTLLKLTPEEMTIGIGLKDIIGREIAFLQMDWPRRIALHGERVQQEVAIQRWLGGAVLALALLILVDRLLVAPLKRLHKDITRVTTDGDWAARVNAPGHDEIADVARSANRMLDVIQTQVGQLQQESMTDAVTGLPNRRAFDQRLQQAMASAQRNGRALSVVMFDLDRFKAYNDHFGHLEGDRVLRTFAQCLREALHRPGDLPARHGGEEFAVLLEDTDLDGAMACAQSIIEALAELGLPHPLNLPTETVTCSAGVATLGKQDTITKDLVLRADKALYDAKHGGRNRVCAATA